MTSLMVGPPRSKDTSEDTAAPACATLCLRRLMRRRPAHQDRACRGTEPRVFQECLSLLADRRTQDLFGLASNKLLALSGRCLGPPNRHGADIATALYERSGAAAYGVSAEQFAAILDEILRKYLPDNLAQKFDP